MYVSTALAAFTSATAYLQSTVFSKPYSPRPAGRSKTRFLEPYKTTVAHIFCSQVIDPLEMAAQIYKSYSSTISKLLYSNSIFHQFPDHGEITSSSRQPHVTFAFQTMIVEGNTAILPPASVYDSLRQRPHKG